MSKRIAGPEIERLIQLLAKVPGLGPRSARRRSTAPDQEEGPADGTAGGGHGRGPWKKVRVCSSCGNVDTTDPCTICTDPRRDPSMLIVVEDVSDLWALERAAAMNTRYHVLGGTLSPLDGIGSRRSEHRQPGVAGGRRRGERDPSSRSTPRSRGRRRPHYITDQLANLEVKVTRLAHGVPVGGELDYLDEGTLTAALKFAHGVLRTDKRRRTG